VQRRVTLGYFLSLKPSSPCKSERSSIQRGKGCLEAILLIRPSFRPSIHLSIHTPRLWSCQQFPWAPRTELAK
jgi:hypothetical protein